MHSLYFAASDYRLRFATSAAASVSALFIGISNKRFSIKNNKHYNLFQL
jgi:hypothetical protein